MYTQKGASLIISLGFSLALLFTASFISQTIYKAMNQSRNIEDYTIAFYAAEAGIEQGLYTYNSQKKGYNEINTTVDFSSSSLEGRYTLIGQIDETICPLGTYTNRRECQTSLTFGSSVTFQMNYSDDGTTVRKENIENTYFNFDFNTQRAETPLSPLYQDAVIALSWVGGMNDGSEKKFYPQHNPIIPTFGFQSITDDAKNDRDDCSHPIDLNTITYAGKYICLRSLETRASFSLQLNASWQGGEEVGSTVFTSIVPDFFNTTDPAMSLQNSRTIKWFYVNPIYDEDQKIIDTITVSIAPQNTMTAPKTIIRSFGRSKIIQREIEVVIDTTRESLALDYSILLD